MLILCLLLLPFSPFLISLCIFSKGPCLCCFICYLLLFSPLSPPSLSSILLPFYSAVFTFKRFFEELLVASSNLCSSSLTVICLKNYRTLVQKRCFESQIGSDLINTASFVVFGSSMLFHTRFSHLYLITSISSFSLPSSGGPPQWELKACSSLFFSPLLIYI